MRKNFLNDQDGMSARDFILTLSIVSFVVFWIIGLVSELMGNSLSVSYLDLFSQMKTVVMTIVASIFAVTGVKYGADAISGKRNAKDISLEERQKNKPYPRHNGQYQDYPEQYPGAYEGDSGTGGK